MKRIILIAFLLATAFVALRHPVPSWDVLAYTGAAIGADAAQCQAASYGFLRNAVDSASYAELTTGSEYDHATASDARCFVAQFPYYWMKPGYVLLLRGAYLFGFNPVAFAIALSLLFSILLAVGFYRATGSVAITVVALLALSFFDLAGFASPDMLAAFVIFAACGAHLKEKPNAALALLLLATFIRLDAGLLAIGYAGLRVWSGSLKFRYGFAVAALVAAATLAVQRYAWSTLFHHTFIAHVNWPSAMKVSPREYLGAIGASWRLKAPANTLPLFAVAGYWAYRRSRDYGERSLLMMLGVTSAIHYLMFPLLVPRFFMAQALTGTAILWRTRFYIGSDGSKILVR